MICQMAIGGLRSKSPDAITPLEKKMPSSSVNPGEEPGHYSHPSGDYGESVRETGQSRFTKERLRQSLVNKYSYHFPQYLQNSSVNLT